MEVDPVVRIPFATIDEIAEDSPAAEDGLQLGDEIVKFGKVEIGERLQERLMLEAQLNEGHPVSVLVMRRGAFLDLIVTPRPWRGRGLLGYVLLLNIFLSDGMLVVCTRLVPTFDEWDVSFCELCYRCWAD